MYQRFIINQLQDALAFSPVVYLAGSRQCGKSTLAELISQNKREYLTLDNLNILQAAKLAPMEFVEARRKPCIIDEIQRAPELILPIKQAIDKDRKAGYFLLTGSANILSLPQVADSLAGRMTVLNLYPLSIQEINRKENPWITKLFDTPLNDIFHAQSKTLTYKDLCHFIIQGGYPVIWQGLKPNQRSMWFQSYIKTMIERDLREIAHYNDIIRMHRLFKDVLLRSATIINSLDLARNCQIPATSVTLYLEALESIFLVSRVPAWFTNRHKRLTKAPKLFINDSGLLCDRLNITEDIDFANRPEWGQVVETFVYNELRKQLSWNGQLIQLFHYRTYHGKEVDIVLENHNLDIIGIEVKASKTISSNFTKGLLQLSEDAAEKFKGGIIFYMGEDLISLGNKIFAVPISFL